MLEANAVIVAMPTTIVAAERLRFDPPLPDDHIAGHNLPLGVTNHAFGIDELVRLLGGEWRSRLTPFAA